MKLRNVVLFIVALVTVTLGLSWAQTNSALAINGNVFVNKNVESSQTSSGNTVPASVVDGNHDMNSSSYWLSYNYHDWGQWLVVDAGAPTALERLSIYQDRTMPISILGSYDNITWFTVADISAVPGLNEVAMPGIAYRYYRIWMSQAGYWKVAEVEGYSSSKGTATPLGGSATNVFLRKSSSSSQTTAGGKGSNYAVDGDPHSNWSSYTYHNWGQWITVDMGTSAGINRIRFNQDREMDITVQVSYDNNAYFDISVIHAKPGWSEVTLPRIGYRYYRLWMASSGTWNIFEIQGYLTTSGTATPVGGSTNQFLNKTGIGGATSTEPYAAKYAYDGDPFSFWRGSSNYDWGQSIVVDLAARVPIKTARINQDRSGSICVRGSNDGNTWSNPSCVVATPGWTTVQLTGLDYQHYSLSSNLVGAWRVFEFQGYAGIRPSDTPTGTPTKTGTPTPATSGPTLTPTPTCPASTPVTLQGDDEFYLKLNSSCNADTHLTIRRHYGDVVDSNGYLSDQPGRLVAELVGYTAGLKAHVIVHASRIVPEDVITVNIQGITHTLKLVSTTSGEATDRFDISTFALILPPKGTFTQRPPAAHNRVIITHSNGLSKPRTQIDWIEVKLTGQRPLVLHSGFDSSITVPDHVLSWTGPNPVPGQRDCCWSSGVWDTLPLYRMFSTHPMRDGHASIVQGGKDLSIEIEKVKTMYGVARVNIVAHSMGGLWSREYVKHVDKYRSVDNLIMLGTPNAGSGFADWQEFMHAGCLQNRAPEDPRHFGNCTWLKEWYPKVSPAIRDLTTSSMTLYNRENGNLVPATGVSYTDLAGKTGKRDDGGVENLPWLVGDHDTLVSVKSVQALPFSKHLEPIGLPAIPDLLHDNVHNQLTRQEIFQNALRPSYVMANNHYGKASVWSPPVTSGQANSVSATEPSFNESMWLGSSGVVHANETITRSVLIDSAEVATFQLAWTSTTSSLTLNLVDPSGTVITPTSTYSNTMYNPAFMGGIYTVASPHAGVWTALINGSNLPADGEGFVLGGSVFGNLDFRTESSSDFVQVGSSVVLTTTLEDGQPVAGAVITASIVLLSDQIFTNTLRMVSQPQGGVYRTEFVLPHAGTYIVAIEAQGEDNTGVDFVRVSTLQVRANAAAALTGSFSEQALSPTGEAPYDSLVISATGIITTPGTYRLYGELVSPGGANITSNTEVYDLPTGVAELPIKFEGKTIGSSGSDGPYQLRNLYLSQVLTEVLPVDFASVAYTTTAYSRYDWPRQFVEQPRQVTEHGIDTNNNQLFDYLEVSVPVDVKEAGLFGAGLNLVSGDGEIIATAQVQNQSLDKGESIVTFQFTGSEIRTAGKPGPYRFNDLSIWSYGAQPSSYTSSVLGQTRNYQSTAFEPPLVPTNTPTTTPTNTSTGTATNTPTSTPTSTQTNTATQTATNTPTPLFDPVNHGLVGEYFSDRELTSLRFRRYDADVNFNWGQGSPDPLIAVDNYSIRWTGQIEIPADGPSGVYTFYTVSDDGIRLWVNGQQVVNNWTNHAPTENSGALTLQAGQRYDIKLEYFEAGGGAVARLLWQPPSGTKEVVPSSRLYPATSPAGTHGLKGEYFQGMNFEALRLARFEDNVDYDWGNWYPDPVLPVDAFSVRWTGSVRTPDGVGGTYTFYTVADDGVRLWVNDQLIITDWTTHAPQEKSGAIALQGGQTYNIKLEYYEDWGGALVQLLWLPPGGQKQIIPGTRFYPLAAAQAPTPTPTSTSTPRPGNCEAVTWTGMQNVTATGNSIKKTGGAEWVWDASGVSSKAILSGDGGVEVSLHGGDGSRRHFGLGVGNSSVSYEDVDYAFVVQGTGVLIWENNSEKANLGARNVGDVLRVAVESGIVKYYINGSLVYTSQKTPSYPLILDTSIANINGQILDGYVCGSNLGIPPTATPTATATSIPSNCEPVTWTGTQNVTVNGNSIEKTSGAEQVWDASGISTRSISSGNGQVMVTMRDTGPHRRHFGFGIGNSSVGYEDVDFSFVVASGGIQIWENTSHAGDFGGYQVGDVLKVAVENGIVKYYRNDTLLYTSTKAPVYPLIFDDSIWQIGGKIENAYICGSSMGSGVLSSTGGTMALSKTSSNGKANSEANTVDLVRNTNLSTSATSVSGPATTGNFSPAQAQSNSTAVAVRSATPNPSERGRIPTTRGRYGERPDYTNPASLNTEHGYRKDGKRGADAGNRSGDPTPTITNATGTAVVFTPTATPTYNVQATGTPTSNPKPK